jgi:predicted PurR-regulated permease PerM
MARLPMRGRADGDGAVAPTPRDVAALFVAPPWLRDLGRTAWLLVGVALAVVGAVWLLTLTQTIVTPVIAAAVVAAVASPLITWLGRHRVPRGAAAALLLVGFIVLGLVIVVVVVGGISGQADALGRQLDKAKSTISDTLQDVGVEPGAAAAAVKNASATADSGVSTLLEGVGKALSTLSSLVVFLSLTALSLFFLLKDGPQIRGWAEQHLRVPPPVAHSMTQRVLESLRGYFLGVTLVAAFNAVLVGGGALVLGVPLPGTIAAITFLGAYVPYLGAWGAGVFSVLIALGGAGTDAAIGMTIIQLLANGVLQQMIQPIAYGTALGIHPLAVLIVTIAGGALFGAVGLILAAPLTAAATRIAADLAAGREEATATAPPPAAPAVPG